MGINSRSSLDPRYKNHARLPLSGFATATVQLIIPNTEDLGDDYNPWTNLFSNVDEVQWTGEAQIAVFRQTLNTFMPVGAITQVRSIRFSIPSDGPLVPIRKGQQVRVTACPEQPDVCHYQYTITSGIIGNFAFTRDIEAEADMGVVV